MSLPPTKKDISAHPARGSVVDPVNKTAKDADVERKMKFFGVIQAFRLGRLPTNKQINSALDYVLEEEHSPVATEKLSSDGKKLIKDIKAIIKTLKVMVHDKNGDELLQQFLWHTRDVEIGDKEKQGIPATKEATMTEGTGTGASSSGAAAGPQDDDQQQAIRHLRTLLSLVLTNSEVRKLLSDFSIIGRDVLSTTLQKAASKIGPTKDELSRVDEPAPSGQFISDREGRPVGPNESPVVAEGRIPGTDVRTSEGGGIQGQDRERGRQMGLRDTVEEGKGQLKEGAMRAVGGQDQLDVDDTGRVEGTTRGLTGDEKLDTAREHLEGMTQEGRGAILPQDEREAEESKKGFRERMKGYKESFADRVPSEHKERIEKGKKFLAEEYFPPERRDQFIYRGKKVGYIPIPRIEYTDETLDLVVENLTLSGRNLFPNIISLEAHNFLKFSPYASIKDESRHKFTLTFAQMQADMRDVAFYYRKKSGMPKIKDSGLADVVVGGEGVTATAVLVSAGADRSSVFKVQSVHVKVDSLKFSIRDSKHDLLYKTLKPLATGLVKRQIQKALQDAIQTGLEYVDGQLVGVRDRMESRKMEKEGGRGTDGERKEVLKEMMKKKDETTSISSGASQSQFKVVADKRQSILSTQGHPAGWINRTQEKSEMASKGEEWRSDALKHAGTVPNTTTKVSSNDDVDLKDHDCVSRHKGRIKQNLRRGRVTSRRKRHDWEPSLSKRLHLFPMDDSVIVPLTRYDKHHDNSVVTLAYIVQTVDVSSLRNAALRVVDKWRLMAGRIERCNDGSSWCIRVPMKGDVSRRLGFTTSRFETTLDSSYFVDKADPIRVVLRPPCEYFRDPSIPYSLQGYCLSDTPFISIHVTELANCTCIGFTFPHFVLDAQGMGHFLYALNAELHGRPWDIPTISKTNVFQTILDNLEASAPVAEESSPSPSVLRRALSPVTFINTLIHESRLLYELRYRNLETKAVYIPVHALKKLVQKTRYEAKGSGLEFISTGDIITAWMLKATFSNETDNNDVHVGVVISARNALSQFPEMQSYSQNAVGVVPFPIMTKQELAKKSLAEVAVWHRQGCDSFHNDTSWVQGYDSYLKTNRIPKVLRPREWGQEPIAFTNASIAGIENIDFGSKLLLLCAFYTPTEPIHLISINKLNDGYVLLGNLRRTRWNAVAAAVQKLVVALEDPLVTHGQPNLEEKERRHHLRAKL
ncbi:hypothetical protein H0H93_006621 [Arthromyces matolae]|nr:hypothetical protein H0H93_006621 [Arthromyces matolae]